MSSPNKLGRHGTEIVPTPDEVSTLVRTKTSSAFNQVQKASLEVADTTPSSPIPVEVTALKKGGTLPSAELPSITPVVGVKEDSPNSRLPDLVSGSSSSSLRKVPARSPINDVPAVVKRKVAIDKITSNRLTRDIILVLLAAGATYGTTRCLDGCQEPTFDREAVENVTQTD